MDKNTKLRLNYLLNSALGENIRLYAPACRCVNFRKPKGDTNNGISEHQLVKKTYSHWFQTRYYYLRMTYSDWFQT